MTESFKIKTFHGKILSLDDKKNISSGTKDELFFLKSEKFPKYIFCTTVKEDYEVINLKQSNLKGGMIIFEYEFKDDFLYLKDPISAKYICALPSDHDNKIIGDITVPNEWERFTQIFDVTLHEYSKKIISLIDEFSEKYIDYSFALKLIKEKSHNRIALMKVLDAFSIFMKMKDFELLSSLLTKDKQLFDNFDNLYRDDIWNKSIRSIRNNQNLKLDKDLDTRSIGDENKFSSFSHAVQFFIKNSMPSEFGPALLSSCRNEGIYLIEWIAYHKAIGFENIYIYSNNNIDSSDELLMLLNDYGYIKYINNEIFYDISAQNNCYNHALNYLPELIKSSWVLVIDTDEFICIDGKRFENISDYINWVTIKHYDSISLNWRNISSSFINDINDFSKKISFRNQKYLPRGYMGEGDRMIKSIFNPRSIITTGPHHPVNSNKYPFNYGFSNGCTYKWHRSPEGFYDNPLFSDEISFDNAYIAHYFFKSASEWFWKNLRNRGDNKLLSGISFENLSQDRVNLFKNQQEQNNHEIVHNDENISKRTDVIINDILSKKDINIAYKKVLTKFLDISRFALKDYHKSSFVDYDFYNTVCNELNF